MTLWNKKIAILITSFNRREQTLNCLISLYNFSQSDKYSIEVFLVDDGSTDGTGEAVRNRFPQVNVIQGTGNLFWNRGMNLAWESALRKAKFDFFLWLNDDVQLKPDFMDYLLRDFDESGTGDVIIVGACKSINGCVSYSGYKGLKKKQILEPTGSIQECDYFNGNVVLISAEVFSQVGFLDPIFHHGKGDIDYGLRARDKNMKLYVSSVYVGNCELHRELPNWCNPKISFFERWKNFKSPLGGNPKMNFIVQHRHIGLWTAIFHYFTIYIRLLIPTLWTNFKRDNNNY